MAAEQILKCMYGGTVHAPYTIPAQLSPTHLPSIKSALQPAITQKGSIQKNPDLILEQVRRIDGEDTTRKYQKCGFLGRGGFANCHIVENVETGKKSALKIVEKEHISSQRTKQRLLNEIRLHKTLHHANIVEFEHYFEDNENVYIVLELCENQSLSELISVRAHFVTQEIQSFLFGIVSGIMYLHSKHIIHRDLKLGNIFIDSKMNVKIGDFGLATKLEFRKQMKRTVCGTPNYIAPETLEGKGYHFEVDIWSIGVILFTLFFGYPPFETQEAQTTYARIKECHYVMPKISSVPAEAISLIQRILVRNPADRPTLQGILQSSFMNIGTGILKELPPSCSRKAPSKKELLGMQVIKPQTQCLQANHYQKVPHSYVTEFLEILPGTYYYETNRGDEGILSGQTIVYRDKYGQYLNLKLGKAIQQASAKKDLKLLFLAYSSSKPGLPINPPNANIVEQVSSNHVYVCKVCKAKDVVMLRLSNQCIQLMFSLNQYLVTKQGEVYLIDNQGCKLLDKIRKGTNSQEMVQIQMLLRKMKNKEQSQPLKVGAQCAL